MQVVLNGLIEGLTIALLAAAFAMVYLPTRTFHVALGAIYAAVPYFAWEALERGVAWPIAVAAAILAAAILSIGCEAWGHAPLEKRDGSPSAHLITSLGLFIVLTQVVSLVWGDQPKVLRQGVDQVLDIGAVRIGGAQLVGGLGSAGLLVTFLWWIHSTMMGLRLRALAENPEEIALRGHDVRTLRIGAFAASGVLCGAGALFVAYDIGFSPETGLSAVLLAVVAVIVGGRDSFFGPVAGGLVLGVARSETAWYLSARWQEAVTFMLLAAFLYLRPDGLLGRTKRVEARK